MTRQPLLARRAESLLGVAVSATSPVAGGDTSTATRLRLADGRNALMKTQPGAPAGFFEAEARGLALLAGVRDGVAVPEVLAAASDCLVLRWIDPGRPSADAAATLGAALARTHAAPAELGAPTDGFIGRLPMPCRAPEGATWAEFYAVRRVLPYLKLARDRGAVLPGDAAKVEGLLGRLPDLVPEEPAALLHGDLWNGNVLWGTGGSVHVVDPAAYGGHREVDLAMLSLFGLPHLAEALAAYEATAAGLGRPLVDGWRERAGIHQLFPLLVHAALFGGGYGARAAAVAAAY
ncbi:fructosamine kinase family protein [Nocardioides zeae]|uniref:Fructosamine kinase family protein n=1 Tax=Nocardioides imazamoxiresistens TaxID=3231893 RepID=A0ABU3PUB7_9ACTN|nr:fructosamine kinase family protein [Nocardioides zeae]MDT9592820.1 fructosamine kinase family protein [Nocardioides zeae]